MDEKCIWNCEICGNTEETSKVTDETPACCEKPMNKKSDLPVCEATTTAEHARMDNLGEPCDDGRGR